MEKSYTGNAKLLRQVNKGLVLDVVKEEGPISRSALVSKVGLSNATVYRLIDALVEEKLLIEVGEGRSTGGRRPTLLEFNSSAHYVMGIEVGVYDIVGVLTDLDANIISSRVKTLSKDLSVDTVIRDMHECIDFLLEEAAKVQKAVRKIGIAFHGVVDSKDGTVLFAPRFSQWENISIGKIISKKTGIAVMVENHMWAHALIQRRFGPAQGVNDYVYLYTGRGVGGCIVRDGRIFDGLLQGAGEIGHMTIEPNGSRCSCGNYGCLETLVGLDNVKQRITTLLAEEGRFDETVLDISDMLERADKEIHPYSQIFLDVKSYLSVAIANIINFLSINKVFISGYIAQNPDYVKEIESMVQKRVMKPFSDKVHVMPGKINERTGALGAALLCLENINSKNRLSIVRR